MLYSGNPWIGLFSGVGEAHFDEEPLCSIPGTLGSVDQQCGLALPDKEPFGSILSTVGSIDPICK